MHKQYDFFADPGHGWLKVPTNELLDLDIYYSISSYSYMDAKREFVYLEEDRDYALFHNAMKKLGIEFKVNENVSNRDSFIRNMNSFTAGVK